MSFDKFVDRQTVSEERRKAIQGFLETMSLVDLQQIVKELSDFEGDPWRENFVGVIEAHPEASFYRAVTQEGAIIFYCPGDDTGLWFLPGSGMGPLGRYGRSNAARTQYGAIHRNYAGTLSVAFGGRETSFTKRRNKGR